MPSTEIAMGTQAPMNTLFIHLLCGVGIKVHCGKLVMELEHRESMALVLILTVLELVEWDAKKPWIYHSTVVLRLHAILGALAKTAAQAESYSHTFLHIVRLFFYFFFKKNL